METIKILRTNLYHFCFIFLCLIGDLKEKVNLIILFYRIPDSAAEPDLEIHATTDPAVIPLDDVTGSTDSTNDFTSTPWPEPRVQPPAPPPPVVAPTPPTPIVPTNAPFQSPPMPFPQQPQPPFPPIGPFMPGPAPGMQMPPAGDCWRVCHITFFAFYLFCKVLDYLINIFSICDKFQYLNPFIMIVFFVFGYSDCLRQKLWFQLTIFSFLLVLM